MNLKTIETDNADYYITDLNTEQVGNVLVASNYGTLYFRIGFLILELIEVFANPSDFTLVAKVKCYSGKPKGGNA